MCSAIWYDYEQEGPVLGGRIVARACPTPAMWRERYCREHGAQLAEVARLGLTVPSLPDPEPELTVEQPALL